MTEFEQTVSSQIARCNEKWENIEEALGAFKDDIGSCKDDTREILKLLRGEGPDDAGLVGRVRNHEQRLNAISKLFTRLWASLVAIIGAIIGSYFKPK